VRRANRLRPSACGLTAAFLPAVRDRRRRSWFAISGSTAAFNSSFAGLPPVVLKETKFVGARLAAASVAAAPYCSGVVSVVKAQRSPGMPEWVSSVSSLPSLGE